jgi:diguanylate cyclase (GGDEF)-like protein/PAS domain S-box-containing protein
VKGRDARSVHAPTHLEGQVVSEYEFLVEQMRQAVWRLDATGKVIEANGAACKWLELPIEQLVGRNIREVLLHDVDVLRDESFEAEFRTATGLTRVAVVASRVLRHTDGMPLGALQVVTDVTANRAIENRLVQEIQKMARMAGEDPLTGLPNRRAFDIVLEDAIANATQEPFSVLLLDLNDFKPINDALGHEAGDEALRAFGKRLGALVRDTDFVARIGGDEFAVVLSNTERTAAERAAERFRKTLDLEVDLGCRRARVWASVGIAHSADGAATVFARADVKMYENKRREKGQDGRNGRRLGLA